MRKRLSGFLLCGLLLLAGCGAQDATTTAAELESVAQKEETEAAETQKPAETQDKTAPEATEAAAILPDWTPSGPVTMIVAYKEGSSTDIGARLFAQYAQQYVGQTIEIKNIGANSGMTGWETLATAAPNGQTIGFINMPNIFTAIDNGGNFSIHDFEPICTHVIETSVVVVAESSPYYDLESLVSANRQAAASGEPLRAATNGVQASNDIGAALLAYSSGGWQFKHVAYGSTSDQLAALLSGECDWGVAKVSDVLQYLGDAENAPRLRVLAIFNEVRDASLPDVPTLQELGYPTGWYGSTRAIVAPKGTDPNIIAFYDTAFRKAMNDPACIAAHKSEGLALSYMTSEQLGERIDERERFNHSLLPKLFMN